MCTVTYVPKYEGYILTSNRDETLLRATLPPEKREWAGRVITCPIDIQAGGTWIGHDDRGNTLCLLNGADENFIPQSHYTDSRGQVILNYLGCDLSEDFWEHYSLKQTAPFTLVVVKNFRSELMVVKWNGIQLEKVNLDMFGTYIWSSATLYNTEQRKNRAKWWQKWCDDYKNMSPSDVWSFHNSHHGDDRECDVLMERINGLKTVSITQIVCSKNECSMQYEDLVHP